VWCAPWGVLLAFWGASVVCMMDIFILNEVGGQARTYIFVGTLLVLNIKLALLYNLNFIIVYINLEKYVFH
jgi:hypothetical protein